jgi:hypothetical protein
VRLEEGDELEFFDIQLIAAEAQREEQRKGA